MDNNLKAENNIATELSISEVNTILCPCKIDDVFYTFTHDYKIFQFSVDKIDININRRRTKITIHTDRGWQYNLMNIGIKIFYSHEEAEEYISNLKLEHNLTSP